MDLHEVEVEILENGHVKIHVRGAKGMECLEITQSLEASLGNLLLSREMTFEADQAPQGNPTVLSVQKIQDDA